MQKERHSSNWLGDSVGRFAVRGPVNIHISVVYYNQSFVGVMYTQYPTISLFSCDFLRSSVLLHTFCADCVLKLLSQINDFIRPVNSF